MSELKHGSGEKAIIEVGEKGGAEVAAKKREEAKGRAPDLESYIRLNKQIVAPQSELFEVLSEEEKKHFMSLPSKAMQKSIFSRMDVYYKDENGDLAGIDFDLNKIEKIEGKEYYGKSLEDDVKVLYSLLKKLGFTKMSLFGVRYENAEEIKRRIQQKRAEKLEKEKSRI